MPGRSEANQWCLPVEMVNAHNISIEEVGHTSFIFIYWNIRYKIAIKINETKRKEQTTIPAHGLLLGHRDLA
jgi:hypothetical protein